MKKAQINLGESVAVIFVFFLLIVAGFIFYSKIEKVNISQIREELQDLSSIEVLQIISFLPELQCSRDNVPTYNCFDILKIKATTEVIADNRIHYFDIFRNSKIGIKQIYPEVDSDIYPPDEDGFSWIVYQSEPDEWTRKITTQVPISLYYATGEPLEDIDPYFAFGVMVIDIFV